MLSNIPTAALTNLRQVAVQMEKILLTALDGYGNTFVEPKVELGARFGHLVCELESVFLKLVLISLISTLFGHVPSDSSSSYRTHQSETAC